MTQKKDVISLAKSSKTTAKKSTAGKKTVSKKSEPVLSSEEKRDIKAKAKVDELLQDVDLSLEKKNDILELEETPVIGNQSIEWLEEQVTLLSETNKQLKFELEEIKTSNPNPTTDNSLKEPIIDLFDELQNNHLKMGTNPQSGVGNFRIYCPGFLNRLIKFFPFLADHKKY